MPQDRQPRVLVVGGGGTGAALSYDLVTRGFQVLLAERGELTSGTTGRHHGQLHSGARYVGGDKGIADECYRESVVLRRIAPEAVEYNGGFFVALEGDDDAHTDSFLNGCRESGIPARMRSAQEVLAAEPAINPRVRHAVEVPDGTIDAWRLPLHFFNAARRAGAVIRSFTPVEEIVVEGGRVRAAVLRDLARERVERVEVDYVVNAGGAWGGKIAALAGADLAVSPSPGTMVAMKGRLTNRVVSRLWPPGDADIIVPQRLLSIIGTTQWLAEDPDIIPSPPGDRDYLIRKAAELIPAIADAPVHAVWTAPRPLAGTAATGDVRNLSRDFICVDHGENEGPEGFLSVIGGKATVLRGMAEKATDIVSRYFGITAPCRTASQTLPSYRDWYKGVVP